MYTVIYLGTIRTASVIRMRTVESIVICMGTIRKATVIRVCMCTFESAVICTSTEHLLNQIAIRMCSVGSVVILSYKHEKVVFLICHSYTKLLLKESMSHCVGTVECTSERRVSEN